MRLTRHENTAAFVRIVSPVLAASEAENNLALGICSALRATSAAESPAYLGTVEAGGSIVCVALMTPPRNLVLSRAPRAALEAVRDDLVARQIAVPGVIGPVETAEAFSALWRTRTGDSVALDKAERIYQLTEVTPPAPVPGMLRVAHEGDLGIVEPWARGFAMDCHLVDELPGIGETARKVVRERRLHLWEAGGKPVSMAAWVGPTPNGVRVSFVYTPPDLRGRGYASNVVAALSRKLLASGKRFCFLFTDLTNPTSNRIYQKLGYQRVCDVGQYRFAR